MATVPCYTIEKGAVVRGIPLHRPDPGASPTIRVGEEGRGRRQVLVPLPEGAELDPEGRRLLRVPSRHGEVVAALYIRDHSGFRGGWTLRAFPERLCPRDGEAAYPCPDCGAGGWPHRILPFGEISPQALGILVAEGWAAQGTAGRMGGGPEYLILAHPGRFSISRWGRLYGAPSRLAVEVLPTGAVRAWDARATLEAARAAASW